MVMSFLKEKTNNQDTFIVVFAPIVKVVVAKFAQNVQTWQSPLCNGRKSLQS